MVMNAHAKPHERVAMYLRGLMGEAGIGEQVGITQDELASLTGLSRKTVNQALSDLAARGAVETGYGKIKILNVAALS
jgi:CRP-like cAMP-binding protein